MAYLIVQNDADNKTLAHSSEVSPALNTNCKPSAAVGEGTSEIASNVLFGSLQPISSERLGFNPVLIGAANSSSDVMGKMIDAQSIVVTATATNYPGQEWLVFSPTHGPPWHHGLLR